MARKYTQGPILKGHVGGGGDDPESAIAAAYAAVADGYEVALTVTGLPLEEAECLRACLRAARELAQRPQLSALQSRA